MPGKLLQQDGREWIHFIQPLVLTLTGLTLAIDRNGNYIKHQHRI